MYLDDGLGGSSSQLDAFRVSCFVWDELQKFGFLLAHEKYQWFPFQNLNWLGLEWYIQNGFVRVSRERISKTMSLVNDILIKSKRSNMFSVRLFACLTGQIISMKAVFENVVRIMTRFLYFCIETRASWNSKVLLSETAIQEVLFWSESIKSLNCSGALFRNIDLSETRDFELFSDASDVGYGGYTNPTVQCQTRVPHSRVGI